LFVFLFPFFSSFSQHNEIDSLNQLLKNAKYDTTKLRLLVELSEECEASDILKYSQSAVELADVIISGSEKRDWKLSDVNKVKKYKALALNNIGFSLGEGENIHKAIESYKNGLLIQEEINDKAGMAMTLNNLGQVYLNQGDISKSLESHHKSLTLYEEINDQKGIALASSNISLIYRGQNDFPKALEYVEKSLAIREKINDKKGIAHLLYNLGQIYTTMGDTAKAMNYLRRNLIMLESINDKQGLAYSLSTIGSNFIKEGNIPKALEFFFKSLKIRKEINDKGGIAQSLHNIGSAYFKQKNYSLARDYGLQSLEIAKKVGYPVRIRAAAELLYKIYRQENKWQDALAMHELFVQMRDSIFNQETQKSTFKQQAKYEYEKQQTISEAEHQKELAVAEEEKKRQKIITYSVGMGLVLVVLFSIFIFSRLRITNRQKRIIEQQKQLVDQKNKHITFSINYAKRIQDAILPSEDEFKKCFPEYFLFFQPRDIVSGDFYWLSSQNGKTILAIADCTGHGVPGAFMSMIGNTLLNEIVNEKKIFQPSEILNQLNSGIVHALHQESRTQDDGMDISICLFDKERNKIIFAGANHSMYVMRENKMEEIKGDIYSIGSMFGKKDIGFTQTEIPYSKNMNLYFTTDGFPDQIGGEKGKKFLVRKFQELLVSVSSLEINEQEKTIRKAFEDWKGNYSQLDDVLSVGIKI